MSSPSSLYEKKLSAGLLKQDSAQTEAISALNNLSEELKTPVCRVEKAGVTVWEYQNGAPKGVYLFGTVGRGKSMLMQLLFDVVPIGQKRRVHFHPFMEELHERMHSVKAPEGVDIMLQIASDIAADARLLCFDEFYVTNIGDAMLLGRLLEALFKCGVTLCATSNWAPDNLYQDGHNSHYFHPFMKVLEQHISAVDLGDGTDWRRQHENKAKEVDGPEELFMDEAGRTPVPTELELGHYQLMARGFSGGVAWFSFAELCEKNLGRAEYMDLCHQCDEMLIISDVPKLGEGKADAAMRFVVLIDLLYENQIPTRVFSDLPLDQICTEGPASFAFQRTLSRLFELQSR